MVSFNNLTFHIAKGKKKQRTLMPELHFSVARQGGNCMCGREKGCLGDTSSDLAYQPA